MIGTLQFALFCSAAVLLVITPGPNTIYVTARSFSQGRTAGTLSAIGVGLGNFIHTLAAAIGLSALLMSSAIAYSTIKYAGAAYLIYLGIQMLLQHQPAELLPQRTVSDRQAFYQAILTAVLNPKVALFYLAFLPQFIDASQGNIGEQILFLGTVHSLMTTVWYSLMAQLAHSLRRWTDGRSSLRRLQRWFTGTVLIGLGIRVALPEKT